MSMIECLSIYGDKKLIPVEDLVFRPSAYGVIRRDDRILLVTNRSNGKYSFPGGGIEVGETIEDALAREVMEETGIEIEVGGFLHFEEAFFYYDPLDEAFHSFLFYYRCRTVTTNLIDDHLVEDVEACKPRWVKIEILKSSDFMANGDKMLGMIRSDSS